MRNRLEERNAEERFVSKRVVTAGRKIEDETETAKRTLMRSGQPCRLN
jgi:hypothetical protein